MKPLQHGRLFAERIPSPSSPLFFRVLGGRVSVTMLTPSPLGHAHLQVHHEVPDRLGAFQVGCATCSGGKVVIFQERRKLYSSSLSHFWFHCFFF